MTKSETVYRFEKYILGSKYLSFLCSLNYKVFEHDLFTFLGLIFGYI
jgi:hypothetical protein